jgi:hypothetical protein
VRDHKCPVCARIVQVIKPSSPEDHEDSQDDEEDKEDEEEKKADNDAPRFLDDFGGDFKNLTKK